MAAASLAGEGSAGGAGERCGFATLAGLAGARFALGGAGFADGEAGIERDLRFGMMTPNFGFGTAAGGAGLARFFGVAVLSFVLGLRELAAFAFSWLRDRAGFTLAAGEAGLLVTFFETAFAARRAAGWRAGRAWRGRAEAFAGRCFLGFIRTPDLGCC